MFTVSPAELPDLWGLTILVVEDNDDSLEMLATYLTACGADILQARTAGAGLAYVDLTPNLDAIITDLKMPGMDGVELAKNVRRHPSRSSLPLIALTGFYEEFEQAKVKGFDAFLTKPVDVDTLASTIKALVRR